MENVSDEYLDDLILSKAGHRRLKVAMLLYRVAEHCKAEGRILKTEQFDERLRHLVDAGKFEAFRNILNWRFSEVIKTQVLAAPETAE